MVIASTHAAIASRLAAVPWTYWLLWAGSLVLSISLVALLRTRWGQSRPLQKCAVLSLLVHALLACIAMTVRVVVGDGTGGPEGPPIRVRIVHDSQFEDSQLQVAEEHVVVDAPPLLEAPEPNTEQQPEADDHEAQLAEAAASPLTAGAPAEDPEFVPPEPPTEDTVETTPSPVESIEIAADDVAVRDAEERPPVEPPAAPTDTIAQAEATETSSDRIENANDTTIAAEPNHPAPTPGPAPPGELSSAPENIPSSTTPYAARSDPGRLGLVESQGGSRHTEAAVAAALAWLAKAQSPDGRWDANRHEAGKELRVLHQDRGGAGRNADTGVSGLALLAFLGAGHSHLHGEYRDTVQHGLAFLIRSQSADGNLFGNATLYAQMYCHSMATFALAEAQALTGDERLRPAVTKAVDFSLRAQHAAAGGWRYRPAIDPGDTSQLGWQMMALASAERAGVDVPIHTWTRVGRFLRSVRRGQYGGLASYRSDGPPSTSMTAEALYCRLLFEELGHERIDAAAAAEALQNLLASLPDDDRVNLYYWYYATLALHHQQNRDEQWLAAWRRWNEALTAALISTQVSDGQDAGSWNTNTVWGGYGGRVYTTAVAAMCLEVYYRYTPSMVAPQAPAIATPPNWRPLTR